MNHCPTSIGIARKVAGPGDEGLARVLARRDGIEPDGAHSRCIGEGRLR